MCVYVSYVVPVGIGANAARAVTSVSAQAPAVGPARPTTLGLLCAHAAFPHHIERGFSRRRQSAPSLRDGGNTSSRYLVVSFFSTVFCFLEGVARGLGNPRVCGNGRVHTHA